MLAAAAGHAAPGPADVALLDRLTWGVDDTGMKDIAARGAARFLDDQLHAPQLALPPQAQRQIDAMRIAREPMAQLVVEADAQNKAANAIVDPDQKKAARDAYNKTMNDLGREAQSRTLLRYLYAPDQLREQMTWFWFNHFNVQAGKRDIRAMVGDYEDQAIRSHALGRFRDLLDATLHHPAMLRYLDNDQNAAGHINENYAREIMELHTMGVGAGYTQKDVQELARILTGVGVDLKPDAPRLRPQWQPLYRRAGLFEFNPARHDFGDKQFLGHTIRGSGFDEVEQALDLLVASPATAHHISSEIAAYFVGDTPPAALVDRMAATFQHSRGDITAVLRTLFRSPEFKASLGKTFKDPVHYAVSAVRLAYAGRTILNTDPLSGWLQRMGEGLFAHEAPDGYPMASSAWSGPGQMETRFEIARSIGGGSAGLFKPRDGAVPEQPAFPQIQNALFFQALQQRLSPATAKVLDQAASPQEWNSLYLSSPEFMRR
ncbi:DUF1800 domain-containing protein [Sphingomonas nostoxanthinifaciens]|uniref:DUF1800 domain-containing protein n=1 Tax=Sphingomonas nostoxanthinifaciens TaxID=2872652 RepID=UPI001CC1CA4D|nr:DUF1800 domain-containing protein [Sphingomonas nostoxanthinifaciens]UAK25793.1 DUF1800 domain-containing protein [Sphingomonas nostoxanthinifaciens]